jgi:carboxylesterase type B
MPPQPLQKPAWEGVRRAFRGNPRDPGSSLGGGGGTHPHCVQWGGAGSEDCLTLDVYVPPAREAKAKQQNSEETKKAEEKTPGETPGTTPVMVFIHGGGFYGGGSGGYKF